MVAISFSSLRDGFGFAGQAISMSDMRDRKVYDSANSSLRVFPLTNNPGNGNMYVFPLTGAINFSPVSTWGGVAPDNRESWYDFVPLSGTNPITIPKSGYNNGSYHISRGSGEFSIIYVDNWDGYYPSTALFNHLLGYFRQLVDGVATNLKTYRITINRNKIVTLYISGQWQALPGYVIEHIRTSGKWNINYYGTLKTKYVPSNAPPESDEYDQIIHDSFYP